MSSSIFSGSPVQSAKSLATKRAPPSQLSLYDTGGGGSAQKSDAELEAERLWWSEASERQVKELESSFGSAFRKTAEKLSSDVASCKERLEMLIEAERKQRASLLSDLSMDVATRMDRLEALVESETVQRHTALLELKRGLDVQELALRELEQAQHQALKRLEGRLEDRLHDLLRELSGERLVAGADQTGIQDVHRLLNKMRSDFDSFQVQMTSKDATFMADWACNKSQVSNLEGIIEDLQRKVGGEKEYGAAATEAAITDIRRDLRVVQETQRLCEAQAGSASQEQVCALEGSVSELRRAQDAQQARGAQADALIEELRREAEALRAAADARARTDEEVRSFHEVIMQSTCDLGRGLEEISATVVVAEEKLRKEIEELRARGAGAEVAEALAASSSRLAQSIQEERASRSGEIAALTTRLDVALEQLESPQAVTKADLEKFRGVVEADVQTLRRHVEALGGELKSLGTEALQVRSADAAGEEAKREAEAILTSCSERLDALERNLERRLDEERTARSTQIAELQRDAEASAALWQAENDKPQVVMAAPPANGGLSKVVDEVRNDLCNLKVAMHVLEERCLEADVYQTQAQELRAFGARLDQAEREVLRTTGCVGSLSSRVDACENEVWRTSSETPVFMTRLDVVESDMKRLLRESTTSSADVAALRAMLGEIKVEEKMLRVEAEEKMLQVEAEEKMLQAETKPASPAASLTPAATPPASLAPVPVTPPPSWEQPSTAPPPMLSADLKASIGRLVKRVNATLSSRPVPDVVDQFSRAAMAMQEMRERNVSLREENVGLVEELLAQPVAASAAPAVLHVQPARAVAARVARYSVDGPAPRAIHASGGGGGSVAMPVSGSVLVPASAAAGGSVLVPASAAVAAGAGGPLLVPASAASGGSVLVPSGAASGGSVLVPVGAASGGSVLVPMGSRAVRDVSPVRSARVASPLRRVPATRGHSPMRPATRPTIVVVTTQVPTGTPPSRAEVRENE